LVKEKPKSLYVRIAERDDLADFLKLVPTWIWGATAWFIFTKFFLDKLTDKAPGTEINAAIIASDVAGVTFPPGVALAAQIDVTLAGLGFIEEVEEFIKEATEKPLGETQAGTALNLGQEVLRAITGAFLLITGLGRK